METKTIEEKKIKFLQFSILSPEEIQRISVVEVESDLTFENNMPKIGGLMDQRLGAIDRDFYCTTDYASFIECPGYFGHIKLNKPVFHEGYMGFILLILRCVDHKTSKLVMNPENRKIKNILKIRNPYQRLTKIAKLSTSACLSHKNRKLSDNNFTKEEIPIQPKYSKDGWCIIANFDKSLTSEPTRILTAERIHEICSNISDEDCKKLGLNPKLARPDWMILTILPIPPPSIRPSVMFDLTSRAEDDLTYKLGDIIRTNKSLFQMIASFAPPLIINEQINLLQYHIGSYMNNNVPNLAKSIQRSGRAIKSLKQRLQGKEGRIRGNLMGKRVDFSARTVITPDPNLSLDEIGVPWSIALNLTYPEIVTKFNLDSVKKIVSNGPLCHPGAKYIIRNDGSRIDLRFVKNISEINLEVGFQVERHLQDGDVVLFNRQPSLHKMSMMGHVVKIMHYSTFRMNLSATSPYNADFDGDEMNLHLPQTIEAKAELLHLLMVPKCIISQQGNKPVIGIVQDSLLGSLLLTQRDTFLNRSKFFQILMQVDEKNFTLPPPSILKPQILWSGKQVVSLVIPNISLRRVCLSHPENEKSKISPGDTRLLIKKGILLTGMIDKRAIGSSAGSIIHICYREFGPERTTLFISQFQLIVNCWLSMNGFSVGIGDAIADEKTILDVANTIKQAKTKVAEVNKKIDPSKLIIDSEKLNQESFETQVNKILNNARDKAGSNAQKFLSNSNNIKRMVISGSKGSFINLSQIIACVGQQNVEGKRIPLGFNSRTLPHFGKKNKDPETRGFVQNSYISGLLPSEFFFHSMGGREGLIDTAIKTSETGYIQRRLSKAMEDITVEYDLTVRNGQNGIIEFFYGEDSLDASNLENQKLFLLKLTEREIETVFRFNTSSPCFGLDKKANTINEGTKNKDQKIDFLLEEEFAQINRDREILKQLLLSSEENVATLPVNFDRLVLSAQNIFEISKQKENLITPYEVIQGLKKTEEYCMKLLGLESTGKNFKQDPENFLNATLLFRVYLRATLASKIVIVQYTLTKKAFQWILGEICTQFRKAIVSPGEMVGVIAAQSIGQPATQMTLNTFHYAGVSAKNVTLGVPRLKELINVLKIVKTPSLTIYLNKDCSTSAFRVKRLKQALEFTSLKNVLKKTQFFYDPDPFKTIVNKDRNIMEDFFGFPEETLDLKHLGSWVMKVAIQTEEFVDKKLSSDQFIEKIQKKIKPLPLFIMSSDENSGEIIFRFKIFWPNLFQEKHFSTKPISFSKSLPTFERQFLNRMSHFMNGVNLKDYGTSKIKKIFIRKTNLLTPLFSNKRHSLVKKEYVLDTEGVDLRYILNYTGVDFTRSLSNDIIETFKILGIEASRKVLIQELKNLISFDGSYVNSRHLSLLVDIMTHRGKLMSITRHGINKTDIGPIAKCSFEETVDVLYQSAVFGVSDNLKGVSSSILIGQSPQIGTGKIDLFLSEKFLKKISK